MASSTDIDPAEEKPPLIHIRKRSTFDSSLILGIVLIGLFLALFVLEFSRILTMTGKVNHTSPVEINESATTWYHAS